MFRRKGCTDRTAQRALIQWPAEYLVENIHQLMTPAFHQSLVRNVPQKHHEFVATEARNNVLCTEQLFEFLGHLDEDGVTNYDQLSC